MKIFLSYFFVQNSKNQLSRLKSKKFSLLKKFLNLILNNIGFLNSQKVKKWSSQGFCTLLGGGSHLGDWDRAKICLLPPLSGFCPFIFLFYMFYDIMTFLKQTFGNFTLNDSQTPSPKNILNPFMYFLLLCFQTGIFFTNKS